MQKDVCTMAQTSCWLAGILRESGQVMQLAEAGATHALPVRPSVRLVIGCLCSAVQIALSRDPVVLS